MLLHGLGGSVKRRNGYGHGTFLGELDRTRYLRELMVSSDFYENVGRYESSAAKAVVSHKVDETEAGQITTTMIVSLCPRILAQADK
jgi:hypothetical protein